MSAIISLLLGLIPPLAVGPAAGITFLEILKRRKSWYQIPFWAMLALVNLLIMLWVAGSSGIWSPIASLSAFIATPIASILAVVVMRNAWHRLESVGGIEGIDKRWFILGLVLIPVLQISSFALLLIYGPWLCKAGLVICQDV